MKKIILILIIVFSSCNDNKRQISNDYQIQEIKIQVNEGILNATEIIDSANYFLLNSDMENLIGEISKIQYKNDKIFILDSKHAKSLFIYNSHGEFLTCIKNHGKGPGEFLSIIDFNINNFENTVDILDEKQKKIIQYNFDGNLKKEVDFQPWGFCFGIINKNEYVISSTQVFNSTYPHDIHFISESGSINGAYFLNNKRIVMNFSTQTCFYENGEALLYKPNYSDTIFSISKNIKPYIHINFLKHTLPLDDMLDKLSSEEITESNYAYHIENYLESNDKIYFRFSYRKELRHVFYSKKTKKIKFGVEFLNDFDGLFFIPQMFFLEDKLACIFPSFVIDFYKDLNNIRYFEKLSPEINQLINKTNLYTNGFLVVYSLSDF